MKVRHIGTIGALLASLVAEVEGEVTLPTSPGQVRPLMVGASMPAAQLKTAAGEDFDLDSAIAAKPAILVFYRGGW